MESELGMQLARVLDEHILDGMPFPRAREFAARALFHRGLQAGKLAADPQRYEQKCRNLRREIRRLNVKMRFMVAIDALENNFLLAGYAEQEKLRRRAQNAEARVQQLEARVEQLAALHAVRQSDDFHRCRHRCSLCPRAHAG
jgi:hypothetical protein